MKNNTFCIFAGHIKEIHHLQGTITIQIGNCEYVERYSNERCMFCERQKAMQDEITKSGAVNYGVGVIFGDVEYPVICKNNT